MEHEDNKTTTQLDNYLRGGNFEEFSLQQNQQNLVENLQIAGGIGCGAGEIVGGGVVDEIVGGVNIGGKFEEEEHDEDEWKYIEEVQQSEKQRAMKDEDEEGVVGVGVGGVVAGERNEDWENVGQQQLLLPQEVDDVEDVDEEEAAIIKNDGDFSSTSINTTSLNTAGDDENSAASATVSVSVSATAPVEESEQQQHKQPKLLPMDEAMLQVQMEIETQLLQPQENNSPTSNEEESSLATTTTNSSSGCGENIPQQQQHQQYDCFMQHETQAEKIGDFTMFSSTSLAQSNEHEYKSEEEDNKENADPEAAAENDSRDVDDIVNVNVVTEQPAHLTELDFDYDSMHSNLNPEAKEFVPTFSNPASPTSPLKNNFPNFPTETQTNLAADASPTNFGNNTDANLFDVVGEPAATLIADSSPHPSAVPRHMVDAAADDVVAQSPRKGRGSDMDAISLPAEIEFEHEAAKRPHELEQEGDFDLIGDGNAAEDLQMINNGIEKNMHELAGDADTVVEDMQMSNVPATQDFTDFQITSSPVSLIDHGPETSVDLDMDHAQDVMKQSIYIENVEQQQPQEQTEQPIEELLNTVQLIPTDLESINTSFTEDLHANCAEIAHKELLNVEEKEVISHSPSTEELQMQFQNEFNASTKDIPEIPIDMDMAGHMQESFYVEHTSFDTTTTTTSTNEQIPAEAITTSAAKELLPHLEDSLLMDTTNELETTESINEQIFGAYDAAARVPENFIFTDFSNNKVANELVTPTTPYSTEEKHLVEETKETFNNGMIELDQQMGNLLLEQDGSLLKVEEVAQHATTINEGPLSPFFTQEFEPVIAASHLPELEIELQQRPHDDEPIFEAEQQQQHLSPSPLHQEIEEMQQIEEIPQLLTADNAKQEIESAASPIPEPVIDAPLVDAAIAAVAVATTAAIATTAAAAVVSSTKKAEPQAKKQTPGPKIAPSAAKSKVGGVDAKKPTSSASKPTTATARPRTAPATGATRAGLAEKKTTAATTTAAKSASATSTTARKPLSTTSTTAAAKSTMAAKTTIAHKTATSASSKPATTAAARNGVANRTAAPRPATATTAATRKPLTASTTSSIHGPAARPRPATAGTAPSGATKPSTLGIAASAKPKMALSPRTTMTSQLRKLPAAKSPAKPAPTTTGTTNGSAHKAHATSTAATTANRITKTTTTTTTKTFTARPAPKATSTTTTATSRRTTLGGTSASNGVGAKTSSTMLRKSSPSKSSTASASGKLSPTKPPPIGRNRTKDASKITSKPVGEAAATLELLSADLEPLKTNGKDHSEHLGNGENGSYTHDEQQNGSIEQPELALYGDGGTTTA